MKVILIKTVPKVGQINDVYSGADGFCRNYLLRNNLAIPMTPNNSKIRNAKEKKRRELKAALEQVVTSLAVQLNHKNITFLLQMNTRLMKTSKAITHSDVKKQILVTIKEITDDDLGKIEFKFNEKNYGKTQKAVVTLIFNYGIRAKINIDIQ